MITSEEIKVNLDEKLCYINNKPIKLTKTEFNILVFFLLNPNKVYTRKELADNIWTTDVSDRAVDVNITRLRKKLGDSGKRIYTRNGFGYGFKENETRTD